MEWGCNKVGWPYIHTNVDRYVYKQARDLFLPVTNMETMVEWFRFALGLDIYFVLYLWKNHFELFIFVIFYFLIPKLLTYVLFMFYSDLI